MNTNNNVSLWHNEFKCQSYNKSRLITGYFRCNKTCNFSITRLLHTNYWHLFFFTNQAEERDPRSSIIVSISFSDSRSTDCCRWLWKLCKLAEQTNVLWFFNSAIVSVMSWRIRFPARKIKCIYFTEQRLHFSFFKEKSILTVFIRIALPRVPSLLFSNIIQYSFSRKVPE